MKVKIPVYCPKCHAVNFFDTIQQLCDFVHGMWKVCIAVSHNEDEKQTFKDASIEAAIFNHPDRVAELLEEDGYLQAVCYSCWVRKSQELCEKHGEITVLIRGFLLESNYFKQNYEDIKQKLRKL